MKNLLNLFNLLPLQKRHKLIPPDLKFAERKILFLLSKESSAFVRHRYPVLGIDIQFFFSSSELLLKFVNVGHLHSVHERQPLQKQKYIKTMQETQQEVRS